jgi:hypothetical protein
MGHSTTEEARATGLWMRNSLCKVTVDNFSFSAGCAANNGVDGDGMDLR